MSTILFIGAMRDEIQPLVTVFDAKTNEYGDAQAIAAELRICLELFAAKARILQLKGYKVQPPDLRQIGAWRE